MKAHVRAAFTLVLVMTACAAKAREPLKITVTGFKSPRPERYLMGEPVPIRLSWENLTEEPLAIAYGVALRTPRTRLHVSGEQRTDCNLLNALSSLGYLGGDRYQTIDPRARVVLADDATAMGMVEAGQYEIWLEYDASDVGRDFAGGLVAPIRVESNHFRFEIVAPTGVDAEVLGRFGDRCHNLVLFGEVRETILKEYPTSTYAGWASCFRASPQDPGKMVSLLSERAALYSNPSLPKTVADAYSGMKALTQEQRDVMLSCLAHPPAFIDADRIRLAIASHSLELGDRAAAMAELEHLQKVPDLPPWMKEQADVLMEYARSLVATPASSGRPSPGSIR